MNILFFLPSYGKGGAATSQHWTELSEHLATRHDVVVIAPYSSPFEESMDGRTAGGVRLIKIGDCVLSKIRSTHFREILIWLFMLSKCLSIRGRFDVVICVDTPRFSSFIAWIRKIRHRSIIIMWTMDLTLEQVVRRGTLKGISGHFKSFLNWLYFRSLAFCDKVVVLGSCMKDLTLASGVAAKRVQIIGPWLEDCAGNQHIEASTARKSQGINDFFTVTYRGYAGAWHEFDALLEAMTDCMEKYPIQFLFAGSGPGIDRVASAKLKYGWDRVILQAWMPKDKLGALPYCGDVHLVSLKHNMLGTCVPSKTYGAMAYSRPVIFIGPAECQAARDIQDAEAGIIVQTKDEFVAAIGKLYSDRKGLENFSRNARNAFLEQHCSTVMFRQWDKLIDSIA